ncbi:MAG: cell division protein FtsW [Lachnospiraceae bacterium]|nr:cell division protein FtsW [Lachnospiraceae bacterium]
MDISRLFDIDAKQLLKRLKLQGVDLNIPAVTVFLMAFGTIMIYSASSYESMIENGNPAYYVNKQIVHVLMAIVAMYFMSLVNYRFWIKWAPWSIPPCLILVALTRIGPFKYVVNGAHRWIRIAGRSFQPAEIVKISAIVFTVWIICYHMEKGEADKLSGIAKIMALCCIYAVILWQVTDNMSSAMIVGGIGLCLLFVVCRSYKWFMLIGGCGSAFALGLIYALKTGLISPSGSFRLARIKTWLDPAADAKGYGFQTLQSLYSIGSGGVWGKGLGNSIQKMGIIPEAQNDMIFSIICEELGIFGGIVIMCLFIFLLYRFFLVAQNAPDLAGSLLTVGVLSHVALQVIINIAVVTNLIPNTGVTMPFISYGGTSIIFMGAEIGMVLSVSGRIVLE